MKEEQFRDLLRADFDLEYTIHKQKFANDMVTWSDGTDGDVFGPFAGHSHGHKFAGFSLRGWCYAFYEGAWVLLRDGQSGWRQGPNPYPNIPSNDALTTW